ncbi:hypothetical protein IV454_17520 [Massilia antarctica]|uniref:Uncharacterized protein n=1 Tax=Massilia antarctica TaxID=2765360 RepID=A0AA48W5E7_9BURK|nr:hypothetical protein [Massilia antarctica]QPI47415.1 hypothetical protein IV454_17520 [Massilia antarctica]
MTRTAQTTVSAVQQDAGPVHAATQGDPAGFSDRRDTSGHAMRLQALADASPRHDQTRALMQRVASHGLAQRQTLPAAVTRERTSRPVPGVPATAIVPPRAPPATLPPVVQGKFVAGGMSWNASNAHLLRREPALAGIASALVDFIVRMAASPNGYFGNMDETWDNVQGLARIGLSASQERARARQARKRVRNDDAHGYPDDGTAAASSSSSSALSAATQVALAPPGAFDEWHGYHRAASADLASQPSAASHEPAALAAAATARHNIASFVPLDLLSPETRQTGPFQTSQPDKYFRSQAEHPLLTIAENYKGKAAQEASRPALKKRWQANKNGKYATTGPPLSSLGLRPGNASLMETSLTRARFAELPQVLPTTAALPEGAAASTAPWPGSSSSSSFAPPSTLAPSSASAALSLSSQRDLAITELGLLIAEPDGGAMPYPPTAADEALRFSQSYILRRTSRSSAMADALVTMLGDELTHLRLHHTPGNTSLTIHLRSLFLGKAGHGVRERVVEWLQAYFAGRASVHAARLGIPLGLQIRQSFGFLDTTVANTGESLRLSFGSEPPEYLEALAAALRSFDRDVGVLAAALARSTAAAVPASSSNSTSSAAAAAAAPADPLISIDNGAWNPTSEQRKYAGVYQAMLLAEDDILAYATWVTEGRADDLGKRDPKKGLNDERSKNLQIMNNKASAALRAHLDAAAGLAEVAATALPIQADLDDAAMFAAHLLGSLDLVPTQAFAHLAHEALRNLRAAASRALATLRSRASGARGRGDAHSILRNATETIMEASYVLAAAVNAHADRDPLAEATARVRRILASGGAPGSADRQPRVHFADSGSQAIFNGTLAHMPPSAASGSVDFSATPSVYYETPRVGQALKPAREQATPVRIDTTSPYLAVPPPVQDDEAMEDIAAAASSAMPTTMLDATNTDPFSPEFLLSLPPSVSMVASSTVKLGQSGSDHLQQGSLIDLTGTAPVTDIAMGAQDRQLLAMYEDLRGANEVLGPNMSAATRAFLRDPREFLSPGAGAMAPASAAASSRMSAAAALLPALDALEPWRILRYLAWRDAEVLAYQLETANWRLVHGVWVDSHGAPVGVDRLATKAKELMIDVGELLRVERAHFAT